jgi:hypothetical protein
MRKLMISVLLVCCLSAKLQTTELLSASTEMPPLHELIAEVKNIARQAVRPSLLEIKSESDFFTENVQDFSNSADESFIQVENESSKPEAGAFLEDYQTLVQDLNV